MTRLIHRDGCGRRLDEGRVVDIHEALDECPRREEAEDEVLARWRWRAAARTGRRACVASRHGLCFFFSVLPILRFKFAVCNSN